MLGSLVQAVKRYTEAHGGVSTFVTAIRGLTILRSDHEKRPNHLIFKPALCITVQGSKSTIFGDQRYDYGGGQALVVSIEMPAFSRVAEASPSEPYLGIILEFDLAIMREVMKELKTAPRRAVRQDEEFV